MAGDAALDQQNCLPGHPFAIEWRAGLQLVVDVVVDGDVFAHHLFADAIGEAGALIEHGSSGEIVEEKAHEIEDGGRFENHGPAAGLDFFGMAEAAAFSLARWASCFGIDLAAIRRAGLGPAGGILLHDRDGKFRAALAIAGEKPFGIGQHDRRAGGENAGGGLVFCSASSVTRATATARSFGVAAAVAGK